MPEMTVTVQWPDGSIDECYSPSLVMHDHLGVGETYTVRDFVDRATTALDEASRRVEEKYGFACTSASAQKKRIQDRALDAADEGPVRVLAMEPPLPVSTDAAERSS